MDMDHQRLQDVLDCLPPHAVVRRATLSAAAGGALDGADRISALPDDLLRKIVSCLPIKDAVRTTALSPRWRRIWHSAPLFLYDDHFLPSSGRARVGAIDRVLTGHPGQLHTINLVHCFFDSLQPELAKWSRLLAAGGVQDLVLVKLPPPSPPRKDPLRLPADILRCAKLRHLYLVFWEFPDTANLPDGAGVFPDLRELAILNTNMEDRDLDHMLASSPALEMLALVDSNGLPRHVRLRGQNLQCVLFLLSRAAELAIVDAPSLERLIMWDTGLPYGMDKSNDEPRMGIRIACATKLKVLGYLELGVHKLQIGDIVIMADTKASPCSMVPSVKILALKVDFSVLMEIQMLASFLMCFPNIETLHVECATARAYGSTGEHYAEFFEKLSPIECVVKHQECGSA